MFKHLALNHLALSCVDLAVDWTQVHFIMSIKAGRGQKEDFAGRYGVKLQHLSAVQIKCSQKHKACTVFDKHLRGFGLLWEFLTKEPYSYIYVSFPDYCTFK